MAVDIQKLFNEDLPAAMVKDPDAARQIGGKYQLAVTGDGGGSWFIDLSAGGPQCVAGRSHAADAWVSVACEDFQRLHEDPRANTMPLFFAGKLKVTGDSTLVMRIGKILLLALPED